MLKKSDIIDMYTMEDLIPIVGMLAGEYTDSTSVTYERARQFMEAVLYCIAHIETDNNSIMSASIPTAMEAYQLGYEAVIDKVRRTQKQYNEMMENFDHYNNRNYRDTVQKALPGFFQYYDVRFAPMDTIITMDYPVFGLDMNLEGIDMISSYIDAIREEQLYLQSFSRDDIIDMLHSFHHNYEIEFFNLRECVEKRTHSGGNMCTK